MRYGRFNLQGYFGESFVRVLASAAGLVATQHDVDVTGVDFTFDHPGSRGTTRYPKIEAQVKSWSRAAGAEDAWHYPMNVAHFNELADNDYHIPRYLFLIVVPDDSAAYTHADIDALHLRHCGYWVSLADRSRIDPARQSKVSVHVPRRNILTADVLRALMQPVPMQRVAP
jgi:hypothetical protein